MLLELEVMVLRARFEAPIEECNEAQEAIEKEKEVVKSLEQSFKI